MWTSVFPETPREKPILVDLVNSLGPNGHKRHSEDTFGTFNGGPEVIPFLKSVSPITQSEIVIDPDKSYDSFRNSF